LDEIDAELAFAHAPGPLPGIPKSPSHPGSPATLSDIPESTGVSAHDLELLAQAAAQRAWEMITGAGDSGLKDSVYIDLIRRLTPLLDTPDFDIACQRSKRIRSSVEEDARLWAIGGRLRWRKAIRSGTPARMHSNPPSTDSSGRVASLSMAIGLRAKAKAYNYDLVKVANGMSSASVERSGTSSVLTTSIDPRKVDQSAGSCFTKVFGAIVR